MSMIGRSRWLSPPTASRAGGPLHEQHARPTCRPDLTTVMTQWCLLREEIRRLVTRLTVMSMIVRSRLSPPQPAAPAGPRTSNMHASARRT
jgi:hypothetical protein